jgi:class 3 adenylate cyclase/tetratricopeptide (TPR) repeat protein
VICSNCGAENDAGRKFCGECGTSLARLCPSCGAPNPGKVKFCGECGTSLEATAPAPAAASVTPQPAETPVVQPTTERRLVSVLFADLVGFTTLSEARDSEEVRELLTRYFETCRLVVERYGGTVEKFIGDAVMAVWGTPTANEDDPERAVRAALHLLEAVQELGVEIGASGLQARAGVLTGEATVNLGAANQGMVAGDLVNTASRIQSAAEPGQVLVGDSTKRATDASVAYENAGVHSLKGKTEPVQLWRAGRVIAGRRGLMKSEGLEPPFVGRDRELKLVKDLFHASVDERRAHLVQVSGIAGIGKSRLAWEFFKYMDGVEQLFFWHRGRCLSYGDGVTYWALAEMVRGRANILEGEDRASAMSKLHNAVLEYIESPDEQRFILPRLAHLIGLEERTAHDKSDLFAGWRLFFERLTDQDPVLMVFEDIQWADPSLLEFIDHLMEWSRAFPIFVVTLGRPDTGIGTSTGPRRAATSISLEPLSQAAMEQLMHGFVPGLPPELTARILERAEGVPLYAVETVRMLLDKGLLVQEGPVYGPVGPIEDLDVPETLHALIAARLDGLTAEERRLVQDAAVLGKTFTRAALAALSGLPERDLEPLLAALVAKEVLSVQADPRSPERGQYGFLQDLVRTVAYDTLAKRDRKEKHLLVAEYLERAWGDEEEEIVEVVASHLMDAYGAAPDAEDAREIRERAARMLVRAADRAASLAASEEAETYFRQAAEMSESSLERAELMEKAGQMSVLRSHLDEATVAFEEATRLYEETGQSHAAARVQAALAEVEFRQDHLDAAVERVRRAHDVLSGDEPDRDRATVAAQLGRFLTIAGTQEALQYLEEALELAETLELPGVYSHALSSRGVSLLRTGRLDESTVVLRRALEVALEHDIGPAASRAYNNLAVAWECLDRYERELEVAEEALALTRRKGDRSSEIAWLVGSLLSCLALGRWDEAIEWADEARSITELSSVPWAESGLLDLAPIYVRRGELEAAEDVLRELVGLRSSGNEEIAAAYACVEAELLRAQGRQAEAVERGRMAARSGGALGLARQVVKRGLCQAIEAAMEMGDTATAEELLDVVRTSRPGLVTPYLRGHGARFAARLAAARGEDESVESGFRAAEEVFREIPIPFDLSVTLVEHAEWLSGQDRGGDAEPLASEATIIFERLRAKPWIERASRVVPEEADDALAEASAATETGASA